MRRPNLTRRHFSVALAAGIAVAGLASAGVSSADTTTSTSTTSTSAPSTTTTVAPSTTTTVHSTTTTVKKRPPLHLPVLRLGSRGPAVWTLQRRLNAIGYWLGPPNGVFADSTQQAVFALQKVAGLRPDGSVGTATTNALSRGVRPRSKTKKGYLVEVDLRRNVLLLVKNGQVQITLNTSTGGGYTYTSQGVTSVATTPRGVFHVLREVNGLDKSPLGELWRPKYFYGGFAIHGDSYVPAVPVSHGCVRISNEAMDWIWASNRIPIGTKVYVYH